MNGWRAAALLVAGGMTLPGCGAQPVAPPLSVYKPLGSLQCSGGGTPVDALARQLTQAGIAVNATRCGSDGRMRAAVCGGADGRIGIFDIAGADEAAAARLGFAPLARLPGAQVAACG